MYQRRWAATVWTAWRLEGLEIFLSSGVEQPKVRGFYTVASHGCVQRNAGKKLPLMCENTNGVNAVHHCNFPSYSGAQASHHKRVRRPKSHVGVNFRRRGGCWVRRWCQVLEEYDCA